MQITETLSEGLKRELRVVIGAAELDERLNAKLDELKDKVQLKGFRPGKVPIGHIKKVYGRSATLAGLSQSNLIETILYEGLRRHGLLADAR